MSEVGGRGVGLGDAEMEGENVDKRKLQLIRPLLPPPVGY